MGYGKHRKVERRSITQRPVSILGDMDEGGIGCCIKNVGSNPLDAAPSSSNRLIPHTMIPTDNKCPKVKELIEELQRCDPDDRVRLRVDDSVVGAGQFGNGPIRLAKITSPISHGFSTYVQIVQDSLDI